MSEAKTMKFNESLYLRLKALKPRAREELITRALDARDARASVAPAESVGEAPAAGEEAKTQMALPDPSPDVSAASIVEAGEVSGLVRRVLYLPIPLADALNKVRDQRHAVEMLVATHSDLSHAGRVAAVLDAHAGVVKIATDLRQLSTMFTPALAPRLAFRLKQAAHTWANKLLDGLGEEVPVVVPVPPLESVSTPLGVPAHWEPMVVFLPPRMLGTAQAVLLKSVGQRDNDWEDLVGQYFKKERTRRDGDAR